MLHEGVSTDESDVVVKGSEARGGGQLPFLQPCCPAGVHALSKLPGNDGEVHLGFARLEVDVGGSLPHLWPTKQNKTGF